MAPTLVPDATELRRAQALTSGGWGDLLNRCRRGDVQIVVPDVVIREAARRFGPSVDKDVTPTTRLIEMLRSLGLSGLPDMSTIAEAMGDPAEFYVERLRARLDRHGAEVAPVPEVSQEQILIRDLAARKPFSDSGRGYRDTLIWETILQRVRALPEGEVVYFITKNSDDFCSKSGGLSSDLEQDLIDLGRPGAVTLLPTAVELRAELSDYFDQIDTMIDASWATTDAAELARDAVIAKVETLQGDLAVGQDDEDADIVVPREVDDPTLEALEPDPATFDHWTYETYEGDTTSLGASVEAEATIHGFMFKADWYALDDEPPNLHVVDADWNERYVWVEMDFRLRLTFQVLVIGEGVENISLDSVEILPPERT